MLVMVWSWWQLQAEAEDGSKRSYARHFCGIHLHQKWGSPDRSTTLPV